MTSESPPLSLPVDWKHPQWRGAPDYCSRCGQCKPMIYMRVGFEICLLAFRKGRLERRWLCRECALRLCYRWTWATWILGWWGLPGIYRAAVCIACNWDAIDLAKKLPIEPVSAKAAIIERQCPTGRN